MYITTANICSIDDIFSNVNDDANSKTYCQEFKSNILIKTKHNTYNIMIISNNSKLLIFKKTL